MSNKLQKLFSSVNTEQEFASKAIEEVSSLVKKGMDDIKDIVKDSQKHRRDYYETRRKADREAGVKKTKFKEKNGVGVNYKNGEGTVFVGRETSEEIEY